MKTMSFLTLALGCTALSLSAYRADAADYLYVGDYTGGEVMRFDATPAPNPFGFAFIHSMPRNTQAITSVGSTLIVSQPNNTIPDNHIAKYNINTGAFLSEFAVADSIYDMTSSMSGTSVYATQGSTISQFDLGTGNILASTALSGAWGIAKSPLSGDVYTVTGWLSGGGSVYKYDTGLTTQTLVTNLPVDSLRGGAGIAFKSDGSFYVVAGGNADPTYNTDGIIYQYDSAGTLINTLMAPAGVLKGAFAAAIGFDDNLYVSSFAGACVARFDGTTGTFMDGYVGPHGGGLVSAKTLHFARANAAVPEPGTMALLVGSGISALCLRRRRK